MAGPAPKFVIILAGGKGTRMRSTTCHKVCFPVDGRPAINRAIETYRGCGIAQPIVVVGSMAEQVMATVATEHENVIYAYQAEALGTGHAARVGLAALEALDAEADVLLVAGDRLIEPIALERLFDLYYRESCDLALLVVPARRGSGQGRVLADDIGNVQAVIERRDILQRAALLRLREMALAGRPPTRAQALDLLTTDLSEQQAATAFGDLWTWLQGDGAEPDVEEWLKRLPEEQTTFRVPLQSGGFRTVTPAEADAASLLNVSVYLARAEPLRRALASLNTDNAQHEEYLSDIVNILAQGQEADGRPYVVRALRVDNPQHVLGYNSPAELLEVEAVFRARRASPAGTDLSVGPGYRPISAWLADLAASANSLPRPLLDEMLAAYGPAPALLEERRSAYAALLSHAEQVLGGQTPVFLVRAPGRVNILGRHIDHQGGHCNLMAIDREMLLAVHPRDDDSFHLHNVENGHFADRQFSLTELLSRLPWDDWNSLVNSEALAAIMRAARGDWAAYVQAAVLRLQSKYRHLRLRGMDVVALGNIPVAAGLSSSSALVVASAEATVTANGLEILPSQFVDLCGEGEWYVGTRGGSADHAAMKLGQRGKVARVRFFPFGVEEMAPLPADYRLVICNSLTRAHKAAGARDVFNQRIACYRLGLAMIKARYRQYAPLIEHLRDVNVRNLGVPLAWIYRIILSLPEQATREELEQVLPPDVLAPIFATHSPDTEPYAVRGVVLFGLAECERSRVGLDLLARGDAEGFGRLMRVSHDGDRVAQHTFLPDGSLGDVRPFQAPTSNAYLLDLIADLESGDPERVLPAQLQWQPGAYCCSTPDIDLMVDLALQVPGVAGAQLAGAGLGGCMMALVHREATAALERVLANQYYCPRGEAPAVSVCTPVAGSGVLLDPRAQEGRQ